SVGASTWKSQDNPKNEATKVPEHFPQTNNSGEAVGLLCSTQKTDPLENLESRMDSQTSLNTLTIN
ncbi:hypothetical protein BDQ17DRAFT_1263369, partial [Cyathus striatus]